MKFTKEDYTVKETKNGMEISLDDTAYVANYPKGLSEKVESKLYQYQSEFRDAAISGAKSFFTDAATEGKEAHLSIQEFGTNTMHVHTEGESVICRYEAMTMSNEYAGLVDIREALSRDANREPDVEEEIT